MSPYAHAALVLTRDEGLADRIRLYLRNVLEVEAVQDGHGLRHLAQARGPGVIVVDVLTDEGREGLGRLMAEFPDHLWVVLGTPRSDPVLLAEQLPVYAVEDYPHSPKTFQDLIRRAVKLLEAREMIRQLQAEQTHQREEALRASGPEVKRSAAFSARDLSRVFRSIDSLEGLIDRMVEEMASTLKVSRVGLFLREMAGRDIEYRGGWMMRDDARHVRFSDADPFVRWMDDQAHMIHRDALDGTRDRGDRLMFQRVLDRLGAELLLPLRGRRGVLGWIALGHRSTGVRFDQDDLHELIEVADVMAASLESALLYREVTIQKKLAETLLHSVPTGIVFIDAAGVVRWFSTAAGEILDAPAARAVNKPVEILGSRLADLGRRCLAGETLETPQEWSDPLTHKPLQVMSTTVWENGDCLGVVFMIQDMTQQVALKARQDRVERAAFWTELAASMSHEIRNPLVAIKTFAQLLPERYHDEEFRNEFSSLVNQEVGRLNSIIDQINDFAHPKDIQIEPIDVRIPVKRSIQTVIKELDGKANIAIEDHIPADALTIHGDARALEDCFQHVLNNAVEALDGTAEGKIRLELEARSNGKPDSEVVVKISDNGKGMDPEIRDKVFSPFCTTKARGMGLGLAIAQRTVMDHNGRLDVLTGERGTTVSIVIPNGKQEKKA